MKLIHALLFAAAALAPATLHASPPAPDKTSAHVYLGHVNGDGKFDSPTFAGIPVIKTSNEKDTVTRLDDPVVITCRAGVTLRAEDGPKASAIGRLPTGEKVKLLSVRNWYGYVWAEVDTSMAKVLALDTMSPARDGFTGRSGYGPTPTGIEVPPGIVDDELLADTFGCCDGTDIEPPVAADDSPRTRAAPVFALVAHRYIPLRC